MSAVVTPNTKGSSSQSRFSNGDFVNIINIKNGASLCSLRFSRTRATTMERSANGE
jgi:hypothetical protein